MASIPKRQSARRRAEAAARDRAVLAEDRAQRLRFAAQLASNVVDAMRYIPERPDLVDKAKAIYDHIQKARKLPRCPHCKAEPNEPCVQVRGRFPGWHLDGERVHKSRKGGA